MTLPSPFLELILYMSGQRQRTAPVRFRVGDRVQLKPTLRPQHCGQLGIVQSVIKNRYAQSLDKYLVRLDGSSDDIEVWDIELQSG
jgi:hypothetical protein